MDDEIDLDEVEILENAKTTNALKRKLSFPMQAVAESIP